MSVLSPPPPLRHRSSSNSFRPSLKPLQIVTVSSSPQTTVPITPDKVAPVNLTDTPTPSASSASSSMLLIFASRVLQLLYVPPKHTVSWSAPSTPRSSTDESVLPMSASSQQTNFDHYFNDKSSESPQLPRWHRVPSEHAPILFVILLFPLSTILVLLSLSTLPISVSWPRTLTDLAQLGRELHGYSQSGFGPMAHVIGVMSVTAVWKHAWSIPGSVLWNVLAGALFSPAYATILLTALTTIGSACSTMLSTPLAPFLTHFFPRALDMTRSALEGDSDASSKLGTTNSHSSAWVRLSILRLIGVVPWSGINIACGVCSVAITDCMLGAFIGTLPWTAVTCQIGDILQTVASTPTPTQQTVSSLLTSPSLILKLIFLSFLSLAPILARDRLRTLISHSPRAEDRVPRWMWVQDWRSKIRIPSRSRTRRDLAELVQEKMDVER